MTNCSLTFVVYRDPNYQPASMREFKGALTTDDGSTALPPPDAVVVSNGRDKLQPLRQALAGAGFHVETTTRRRLPGGRQVRAVKCLVTADKARAFKEWIQHPDTIAEGIRFYIPPPTRKALVELGAETTGFYPTRLKHTREPPKVSRAARLRRHNALYVYTTARSRGRLKTKEAVELDTVFGNLDEARLHIQGYGRITARCFEMPNINSEVFVQFARNVLILHSSDQRVRVAVRSPRALAHLNRFLDKLDNLDAASFRSILVISRALPPNWKWKRGLPVPRQEYTNNACAEAELSSETQENKDAPAQENKDAPAQENKDAPAQENTPVVTPSPRQRSVEDEIVFTIFDGTASGIASTLRLRQLLLGFPNEADFEPTTVGDSSGAFVRLSRADREAVERMLSMTMILKKNGFRFAVNPEAESWLDSLLNEFDDADVAVVREVWTRNLALDKFLPND